MRQPSKKQTKRDIAEYWKPGAPKSPPRKIRTKSEKRNEHGLKGKNR